MRLTITWESDQGSRVIVEWQQDKVDGILRWLVTVKRSQYRYASQTCLVQHYPVYGAQHIDDAHRCEQIAVALERQLIDAEKRQKARKAQEAKT